MGQAQCSNGLAQLLLANNQLDSVEDAASHTIDLVSEKGNGYIVCQSHHTLGNIYYRKREKGRAIHHFETALEIASLFDRQDQLFWIHYALVSLFLGEHDFNDAPHVEQAKSHSAEDQYQIGRAMKMQARIWYGKCRLEDIPSEIWGALEIFEKFGAVEDVETCRDLLRMTEEAMRSKSTGTLE